MFAHLKNLKKVKNFWTPKFVILSVQKPSLGSCEVPKKVWARSVQPFWRILDTNKQTDKLNLFIECFINASISILYLLFKTEILLPLINNHVDNLFIILNINHFNYKNCKKVFKNKFISSQPLNRLFNISQLRSILLDLLQFCKSTVCKKSLLWMLNRIIFQLCTLFLTFKLPRGPRSIVSFGTDGGGDLYPIGLYLLETN